MKKLNILLSVFALFCIINITACSKDDDKDTEKPRFDNTGATPADGSKFIPGGKIIVHQIFTDNDELGSFNIEIHNNFDGHSHSTETGEEHEHHEHHEHGNESGAWVFNQDYTIPAGKKSYTADLEIDIPEGISEGDYHFMLRVTDKTGWQEIKAVSIEIED